MIRGTWVLTDGNKDTSTERAKLGRAERDIVALGICGAAVIMFVGTGSSVLPAIARNWSGIGAGPSNVLVVALLLNVALIVFGWRRYRELTEEIGERKVAEKHAKLMASTDPLTGCLNRRSIEPKTEKLLAKARKDGRSVAFIVVDLDNFKMINDLNGHKMGDGVLQVCAERMTALLPREGLIARLGGDEFGCVVPYAASSPDQIDQLASLLIDKVAESAEIDGLSTHITMSVGIASTDPLTDGGAETKGDNPNAENLMHRADIAMYHAKKQGKNCYAWFEHSMENELRFRNELEAGIRKGVRNGEFVPYYEQQVDLTTGELMGFEMLARWHSPEMGTVMPGIFIPVAEEIGLITELSEQLLGRAFDDAKGWNHNLTLSVNISPVQLRDPWFSQKLLKLLTEHNFPAQRLDVEITESSLHENVGVVRSIITSLRNQGVRISLDDFGTGYSSLAQLRTLPFDRLKIDRSFVSELGDPSADSKIVDAIISLGKGLNLPITAEGIENTEILETLKKMGSLKGQGYLYGRPEDGETTRERLSKVGLLASALTEEVEEISLTNPGDATGGQVDTAKGTLHSS